MRGSQKTRLAALEQIVSVKREDDRPSIQAIMAAIHKHPAAREFEEIANKMAQKIDTEADQNRAMQIYTEAIEAEFDPETAAKILNQ